MPAYNAGATVQEAIESIRAQSFANWELIVVDDGSTDNTFVIVKRFEQLDPRIKVYSVSHGGVGNAANLAIEQSRGPIIARMDADDIALPKRLELQLAYLGSHLDVSVVASLVELFPSSSKSEGLKTYVDWTNTLLTHEQIELGRFIDAPIIQPSVCFRRSLIEQYGKYRTSGYPDDYEMWLRWMNAGLRFSKLPEVLLKWRDHENKLTRTSEDYNEAALWSCKSEYLGEWIVKNGVGERPILLWGSGRKTRKRLEFLKILKNLDVRGYIDIDPKKIGQKIDFLEVFDPVTALEIQDGFILAMVGSRGARSEIGAFLNEHAKIEGVDFLFLA
jgi:glycosyltransferase involved in cell wall biosynthesis